MPDNAVILSFFVTCWEFSNILGVYYILLGFFCREVFSGCPLDCLYMGKNSVLTLGSNCSHHSIFAITRAPEEDFIQLNLSHLFIRDNLQLVAGCRDKLSFPETASIQVPGTIRALNKKLKVLDLTDNHLSYVPDFLPNGLKRLYLSDNQIADLEVQRILFLDDLELLYLDGNMIKSVSNRTNTGGKFWQNMHLTNLRKLALQRNQIESVDSCAFLHLNNLTALSLAHNRITALHRYAFVGLMRLTDLDLSSNFLFHVAVDTFKDLTSLTFLSLKHNQLNSLPKGLPMLEWLDVSYNHLQNITEDFKPEILAIEFSNFAHNHLVCDCNMLWLKEAFDRREYVINYLDLDPAEVIPSCGSPKHLANETWDVLSDDVFICEQEPEMKPDSKERTPELQVRGEVLNESAVAVVWKFKSPVLSPGRILIYYYVFGLKSTTLKHVKVLATENEYILDGLSSQSNYMICINLAKVRTSLELEASPILLDQCIEVTTKAPNPHIETTYFTVYWWYILTMITTFVTVIGCITGLALLCSILNRRHVATAKSTYPVDEPLPTPLFPTREEVFKKFNSNTQL